MGGLLWSKGGADFFYKEAQEIYVSMISNSTSNDVKQCKKTYLELMV